MGEGEHVRKALSIKVHEMLFSVIVSGHLTVFKMLSKSNFLLKMQLPLR